MKKILFVILIMITGISCTNNHKLQGNYNTYTPGYIQKQWYFLIKGYDGIANGTSLALNKDSSFHLITCGNIIDGKWYSIKDSLYLKVESNRWRKDSLQKHGYNGKWPQLSNKPYALKINKNRLFWTLKGKKRSTLNILQKVDREE